MNKLKYFKVIDLIDEDIIKEAGIKTAPSPESESGITVSGVERYRRIAWHRLAAVVSAVLLIAGLGAGGALMLKKRPPMLEENTETTADSTAEASGIKASGNSMENSSTEKTEAAPAKTSEVNNKGTKESSGISGPTGAENNDTEENTAAPGEENDDTVTTAAGNRQTEPMSTAVTTAKVNKTISTTTEAVPQHETEPHTERATPEHDPGYIPYLAWNPEDGEWLMSTLSGLSYTPWSYDVSVGGRPPEGYIYGSDGNAYALCFTERWVRRNWNEQAYMPDEIYNYFVGSNARGYTTIYD